MSFPRLLGGDVRLRTIAWLHTIIGPLLICPSSLICDLKFLVPRSVSYWFNA